MKNFSFFTIFSLFLCLNYVKAQDCQQLVYPNDWYVYSNPDSIKVDTCQMSSTYGKWYSKYGYVFGVANYPFQLKPIIETDRKNWSDIDSLFSQQRFGFQMLEVRFGEFTIRRLPERTDSMHTAHPVFIIDFVDYQLVDSVIFYVSLIDSVFGCELYRYPTELYSIPADRSMYPGISIHEMITNIPQNSDHSFMRHDFHKLGFQWNLFVMNLPMAWEITRGKRDIILGDVDTRQGDLNFNHPDLENNFFSTTTNSGNSLFRSNRNEPFQTIPQTGGGHGLGCLSQAIADDDNGISNTMVGTAPNIRGVVLEAYDWDINKGTVVCQPYKYDLDLDATNNIIKMPDVVTNSGHANPIRREIVDHGIVYVFCVGNTITERDGTRVVRNETVNGEPSIVSDIQPVRRYNTQLNWSWGNDPTREIYPDSSDLTNGDKDVKPICVGGTQDGLQIGTFNCETFPSYSGDYLNTIWRGVETFVPLFNFSRDTCKFPVRLPGMTDSEWTNYRLLQKCNSKVDIVAPCMNIVRAANPADPIEINRYKLEYDFNGGGTSDASPQVAGIVGLMLSVNKFMGESYGLVPISQGSSISRQMPTGDPANVHRKVYDIVTFTADKLIDRYRYNWIWCTDGEANCNNPNFNPKHYDRLSNNFSHHTELQGTGRTESYQYDYLEQKNDRLRRWWAQRMGFGRVNAYRCVAHSIANKGEYEYTQSGSLPFTTGRGKENEEGKLLMHFGSKVKEGLESFEIEPNTRGPTAANDGILNVLEWGGSSIPGDAQEYNNQGVTRLKNENSQILICVNENQILAIDGILFSNEPQKEHGIYTASSGKILTTGYMKDVSLSGNLKISDLKMYGTTNTSCALWLNEGSEIYGKIELTNKAQINHQTGTAYILQPKGEIVMNGDNDLVITNGKKIIMKSATAISSETKKLIIQSGGELVIGEAGQPPVEVDLNCIVDIQEGGTLTIGVDSKVNAWQINVLSPTSNLVLNPGAKIAPIDIEDGEHVNDNHKIGKVILYNGVSLTLDNSSDNTRRIGLFGGIYVKAGATLTVNPATTVDLGDIQSESSSSINFEGGSNVRLCRENTPDKLYNVIQGALRIGSPTQPLPKAIVGGYTGPSPYKPEDLCKVWKYYFPKITCPGTNVSWSYVRLKNSNFNNISFNLINAEIEPIDNCDFFYHSDSLIAALNLGQSIPNQFLEVINNWTVRILPMGFNDALIQDLNLNNCRFLDQKNNLDIDWLTALDGPWGVPHFRFHLGGIKVNRLRNITIDNTLSTAGFQFTGLNFGLQTANCSRVTMRKCSLNVSRVGHSDINSSVKLCQNYTYRVQIPHSLSASKRWATFDNHFEQSSKAVELNGTLSGQDFRGNLFYDYYNGLHMDNSMAYLRGDYTKSTTDDPNTVYDIGRNIFEIPITTGPLPPEDIRNPFITLINRSNLSRSDFYFYNYPNDNNVAFDGRRPLKVQCGYNRMGSLTPNHLYFQDPNNEFDPINIVVNTNAWRPYGGNNIRQNGEFTLENYFDLNNPNANNQPLLRIEGCSEDQIQQDYSLCSELLPIVHPCDFFARNTGIWAMYAPTDTILLSDFDATLNDFCNGTLSCECLKVRLFDLMQLATLCDSSDAKIQMVIDCILDKLDDPIYANCDLPSIAMRLGEAYERRGQFENALDQYYYTLYNSQNSSDTTLARWRIMNIEAFQTDTTFGFVYDSLMAKYYARVDRDITKVYVGGGSPSPPPRISAGNEQELDEFNQPINDTTPLGELEQNVPNPFSNETVIKFRLNKEADVRLGIHDNLGRTIKVIIQQRMKPGNYVYTYINEGLASGVYLYLLTTDGKQFTRKMQLMK